jgi:alkylated DNA repair protein alkB family protein 6
LDLYRKDAQEYEEQQREQQERTHNHNDNDSHNGATGYEASAERKQKPQYRILQERRSLLVTRGKIYTDFRHGIAETMRDEQLGAETICNWDLLRDRHSFRDGWFARETRTSLTYRDVLRVANVGNTMKFLGRGS